MEIPNHSKLFKKIFDEAFFNVKNEYDLTTNEVLFLLYLDKNKNNNSASEIVDELMITKSHLSKSIDSLYKRGIIMKKADEADKKITRLFIVDKNSILLEKLRSIESKMYNNIVLGIDKCDLEAFERVLKQMKINFENFLKN